MKKSMVLAVSVAAMLISGGAMALNATAYSTAAAGAPIATPIGLIGRVSSITALGAAALPAQACRYAVVIDSPFNPNESQVCVFAEARVLPLNTSCVVNRSSSFITSLQAGPNVPGALGGPTFCAGFDQLGQDYPADGIQFYLTSTGAVGGNTGVVIIPGQMPLYVTL